MNETNISKEGLQKGQELKKNIAVSAGKYGDEGLDKLFREFPIPLWIYDLEDYKILEVNNAACSQYGYSRKEFLGLTILDLLPDNEKKRLLEDLNKNRPLGQQSTGWVHKRKNGGLLDVEITSSISVYKGLKVAYVQARDKTAQLKQQKKLKIKQLELARSEEIFRLITSTAKDAIILMDDKGNVTMWNNAAERIFGYSVKEVIGKPFHELIATKSQQEQYYKGFAEYQKTGSGPMLTSTILPGLKKDGTPITVEISTSSFKIGNQYHAAAVIRDISEKDRAAEERIQLLEELKQKNEINLAINDALSGFIDNSSPKIFFKKLLDHIVRYTNSEFGFMAQIEYINNQPVLNTKAITDIAWDSMSQQVMKKFNDGHDLIFSKLKSLYGQSLVSKKVFIENNPPQSKHKFKGGLPVGHPPLRAFMSIPLMDNDKVIGMVGIANKTGGYQENDLLPIQPFLSICNRLVKQSIEEEYNNELQQATENIAKELQQFIDTANAPIFGIDSNGMVNEWNQMSEKITGLSKEEVLGKDLVQTYITGDYRDAVKQVLDNALKGIETANYKFPLFTKAGKRVMVLLNSTSRRNTDGEIIGVLGVGQDITELDNYKNNLKKIVKSKTQELVSSLEREKELGKLKTSFVSMASHEFRTPLAAIQAITDVILRYRKELSSIEIDKRLSKIKKEVNSMTTMLEDILIIGKSDYQKLRLNVKNLDVVVLVKNIISEYQLTMDVKREVIFHCNPDKIMMDADSKWINHIVMNLFSNALKYSEPATSVRIHIEKSNNMLQLSVSDDGIGISEKDQKLIFENFYRGKNVGNVSGTGLGLSVLERAVRVHKGTIHVESEIGEGSTFTVSFPLEK